MADLESIQREVEEGIWKTVPGTEKDPGGPAEVLLMRVDDDGEELIRKRCKRKVRVGRRRQLEYDDQLVNDETLDLTIKDWKNIKLKGEVVECTRKNKRWLYAVWPPFTDLINDFRDGLLEEEQKEREDQGKN